MKHFSIILAALLCVQISFAQPGYKTDSDILYTLNTDDYSKERGRLDVYYPENAKDAPVVVWFHGGGLRIGSKHTPDLLKGQGVIVVSANYRYMDKAEDGIEASIDDAAAAVAWTFNNIARYGGDVKKIYVSGHSAGGYLTDMIGLEKKWLQKYGIDADSIAALMPLSGQCITHYEQRRVYGMDPLKPGMDQYAPLTHVRGDCPPILILSGDRELELFGRYEEQAYFWRMLKLNGCKECYLYEFQGYDHGGMPHPAFPVMLQYIRKNQ